MITTIKLTTGVNILRNLGTFFPDEKVQCKLTLPNLLTKSEEDQNLFSDIHDNPKVKIEISDSIIRNYYLGVGLKGFTPVSQITAVPE